MHRVLFVSCVEIHVVNLKKIDVRKILKLMKLYEVIHYYGRTCFNMRKGYNFKHELVVTKLLR